MLKGTFYDGPWTSYNNKPALNSLKLVQSIQSIVLMFISFLAPKPGDLLCIDINYKYKYMGILN